MVWHILFLHIKTWDDHELEWYITKPFQKLFYVSKQIFCQAVEYVSLESYDLFFVNLWMYHWRICPMTLFLVCIGQFRWAWFVSGSKITKVTQRVGTLLAWTELNINFPTCLSELNIKKSKENGFYSLVGQFLNFSTLMKYDDNMK